ncbi:peroxiredoxin family protein [Zhouia sp. PK063]|uniref:peroxiredoxin family protein n=1 Tax=Zhouia sp. PK063 TaxID=3373602 RepID=UPI00378E8419
MHSIKTIVLGVFLSLIAFCTQAQMMNTNTYMTMAPAIPQDISPLLIGEMVPTMQLPDATGKMQNVNAMIKAKPTILVFYRGGWCPYCSKQLSGLQQAKMKLEKMGYQLIAISTDSPKQLSETMHKQVLDYTLLSDSDLKMAKAFGIAYQSPEAYHNFLPKTTGGKDVDLLLPVPSVYILDQQGIIKFEYINPDYKQRISAPLLSTVAKTIMDENKK